ncbi:hypothetical protein COCVIDRAFT_113980 [Bipolaris victoriae FI3]|uniref:Zn(2)-C6 fungal-type domain-containing protein n=1 Tax=Bipolaris victoriae (strain FI3) TaxID=930091 RepID=W7DTF5_BIPV3|nr:hypothetical protein COCVIDRAFT_113980 [Bipolaris victoriae FI3]
MATETRSQDGCWSCRLRKKKCDERRPICTECMCLGLDCHGFGTRPTWMDRGTRQKAQAAKMKEKLAQLTKNRRHKQARAQNDWVAKQPPNSHAERSTIRTEAPDASDNILIDHEHSSPTQTFGDRSQDEHARSQPAEVLEEDGQSTMVADTLASSDDSDSQRIFDDMTFLSGYPVTLPHSGDADFQTSLEDMDFLSEQNFDLPELESILTANLHMEQSTAGLGSQISTAYPSHGTSSFMLPITDMEDAILLAYCIEKVFNWQFPFCSTPLSGFSQGYFLWLMSKSRPLYLASLALSISHMSNQRAVEGPYTKLRYEDHAGRYNLATEEFHRNLRTPKAVDDISMLACTVLLISSSLLHSGKVDWTSHLRTGTSLIAPWIAQIRHDTNLVAAGLLSLWELTSKANTIQVDLEKRIASNMMVLRKSKEDLEQHNIRHLHSNAQRQYDIHVINHTFACAVSVLLEVIVSGAYPRLPEVKQKAGRALGALADIKNDARLLELLAWPLFVVGCVVEEERHGFFRQILSGQLKNSVSLCGLLDLLEECWKSRASGEVRDENFDYSHLRIHNSRNVLIV